MPTILSGTVIDGLRTRSKTEKDSFGKKIAIVLCDCGGGLKTETFLRYPSNVAGMRLPISSLVSASRVLNPLVDMGFRI